MRIPALLLAAGAAMAAPAFAETVTYYLWDPVTRTYVARTMETAPDFGPRVVYADPPATTVYVEPAASPVYVAPDIVVTAPRSEDALITNEIVDRIATHPQISGYVGVETFRNDVTLTGRVTTPGQSRLAEREAKSVAGVDDVQNLIRTRVGGSY
jgi:hypothetical protein